MALLSPPRLHDPYRSSPYSTKNGSDQPNQPPIGYVLGKDGLTTEVVFSSALSWVNVIQWDNGSDILGINSRLHWAPQAGRDFYLVLNHSLQDLDEDGTFSSLGADLTAKASYTFRF